MRTIRILALSVSLLFLFPASVRPQAGSNQTVTASDSRITYVGDWTNQENGGHMFTSVAGSFALDFTGSAVYWFTRKLYNGAVAAIELDSDGIVYLDLSAGVGEHDTPVVAVLYSKQGLDPSKSHRLSVTWDGPGGNGVASFLETYHIEFTTGASQPSTSSSTPASTPSSKPASIPSSNPAPASSSNAAPASSSNVGSTPSSNAGSTPSSNTGSTPGSSAGSTTSSSAGSAPSSSAGSTPSSSGGSTPNSSGGPTPNSSADSISSSSAGSISGSSTGSTSSLSPVSDSVSSSTKPNIGAIVGGTIGGVLIILILIAVLLCLRTRRNRATVQQDMQSATPFAFSRNVDTSIASPSSASSMKPPLDIQNQHENDRSYALTDPTNSTPLLSPEATSPFVSLADKAPNPSQSSFAHSWDGMRSESTSRIQDSAVRSPLGISTFTGTFGIGRDLGSSSSPLGLSSGSTDIQDALEDPPPVYRG